jgi:hypothetical protein
LWTKKNGSAISSFSFKKIAKDAAIWERLDVDYNNASSILSQYSPSTSKRNFALFWQGEPGELPSNSHEPCPVPGTETPETETPETETPETETPETSTCKIMIDSIDAISTEQAKPTTPGQGTTRYADVTVKVSFPGCSPAAGEMGPGWQITHNQLYSIDLLRQFPKDSLGWTDTTTFSVQYHSGPGVGSEPDSIPQVEVSLIDESRVPVGPSVVQSYEEPEPLPSLECTPNFAYGITHPTSIRIYDDIRFSWRLNDERKSETLSVCHRLKRADGSWDSDVFTWTGHTSRRSDPRWKFLAPLTPPFTSLTYQPTPTLDGGGTGSGAHNEYGNIRPGDKMVFHFTCNDGHTTNPTTGKTEYIDVPDRSFYSTEIEVTDISLPLQIHEVSMAGYNFDTGEVVDGGKISHGSPVVVLWKPMSPNGGFELTGDYYRPTIVKVWRVFWAAYIGAKKVPIGTPNAIHGFTTETLIETTVNGSRFDLQLKDDAYGPIRHGDVIWASVRSTTNSGNSAFSPITAGKGLQVVTRDA